MNTHSNALTINSRAGRRLAAKRPSKKDPFAGIPEEERDTVAMLVAASPETHRGRLTPQQMWTGLQKLRAREKADAERREVERAKQRAQNVRECALEALQPALAQLADVRDFIGDMGSIDQNYREDFVEKLARLAITEAGEKLEQALCDLGLIPDQEYGSFVDALRSKGVKMKSKSETDKEVEVIHE